ncbi:phage Gp37/Gp68 family protein [Sphingomonas sp. NFR15]|uniref:phage Gp37/Gp68 family protein n=1 Tax=Sphingomonas sp. NFR15 TaxID=1566282 RepID=UPI000884E676|nr:phage Gp37/Gp68 family protein [Sphingomonas sp. NFR15]SDA15165.1 protein gp37 [Sphingomonas sp. NFR15]
MSDGTKIEWTDATVNAVNGCSVVSPGCTNCYAMRLAGTRLRTHPTREGLTVDSKAGPVWNGEIRVNEKAMLEPLRWTRPRTIFWNAHGDLFHPAVPDEVIDRCFAVMALTPHHRHQVLTKRSARMRTYMQDFVQGKRSIVDAGRGMAAPGKLPGILSAARERSPAGTPTWALPNVWLGVSVEDQPRAEERRADFEATPAAVKFVSYEPALGPVDWTGWEFVRQIIGGGESGPKARPNHPDWQRSTRDWCSANGVAYFFKQWGAWYPAFANPGAVDAAIVKETRTLADGTVVHRLGKKAAGRLLDGSQHNGMPV